MGIRRRRTGILIQDLVAYGNTLIANIGWGLAFGSADELINFVDWLAAERTTPDKLVFHYHYPPTNAWTPKSSCPDWKSVQHD